MALYYRCPCTAVLESPENTQRGKAYCPACGKIVVIPRDAVSLTADEIVKAKKALAEASASEHMAAISGIPNMPATVGSIPSGKSGTDSKLKPSVQAVGPIGAKPPAKKPEEMIPEVIEEAPMPLSFSPTAEEEAANLFSEAPLANAAELTEPEALPDIPEIPSPIAVGTGARTPAPSKTPQAKKQPPIAAGKKAPTGVGKAPAGKPAAKPAGPPIAAGKKPPAASVAEAAAAAESPAPAKEKSTRALTGAAATAASKPKASRRSKGLSCPACGERVMFDDKVCANCGEKLKKGGAFKWVLIFVLLVILAVGGVVAAVMYIPDKVPPVITDNVKKVGAILKDFGVPVPPALLPEAPAEGQAPATAPAPETTTETPEAPATETPVAAPDKMNIEMPKVPDVVLQEPGAEAPAPPPAEAIVE
jgi:hypothetical protein